MWPENKVSRVLEGIKCLQVFIWNYSPVQFGFCMFKLVSSLQSKYFSFFLWMWPVEIQCYSPACYRNILFDFLVSTWMWTVIKFPKSQDAQNNKEFCPCDGHKCQSRNIYDVSRFFKLRSRDGSTKPTVFPNIYKSPVIFYATNVYALY